MKTKQVRQLILAITLKEKVLKLTVIGLTLFLQLTSAWAGTLRDNFDDGNLNGWRSFKGQANNLPVDQSAQWFVEEGELVHISKDVCMWASILGIGDNTWRDYEFECQFRMEKFFLPGCGFLPLVGFGVHFDEPKEFINGLDIVVGTGGGGVWNLPFCERFFQGNHVQLGGVGNISLEQGKWYTAKIIVKGNSYKMFVDNRLLCDNKSDFPDAGAAGLMGKNGEVHFDNVVITGNDIPDLDMNVSPRGKLATTWGEMKRR